jgi:hypothetical protein
VDYLVRGAVLAEDRLADEDIARRNSSSFFKMLLRYIRHLELTWDLSESA